MSNLKVGDLVMMGCSAGPKTRARNAGLFRTVVGFKPLGFEVKLPSGNTGIMREQRGVVVELDAGMWLFFDVVGDGWVQVPFMYSDCLVKINPGDAEDETLNWVGKPNKQTELGKEVV